MKRKAMRKKIALILSALLNLPYAAPAFAISIEGATTSGTYKQVGVTTSGQLQVSGGGANTSPTCNKPVFSTVNIGSTTATVLVSTNANAAQGVFYITGPSDLLISSQSVTFSGAGAYAGIVGSPWARFPNGSILSLDAPASIVTGYYGLGYNNGTSTYTVISIFTCGN